jgi:hypothetical protein
MLNTSATILLAITGIAHGSRSVKITIGTFVTLLLIGYF